MRRFTFSWILFCLGLYCLMVLLAVAAIVYLQPSKSLDFADWMGLAQVALSMMLLPTIILFAYELHNNISFVDAKCKIECRVINSNNLPTGHPYYAEGIEYLLIEPVLSNRGNIASSWFTLRVFIPLDLYKHNPRRTMLVVGNGENWKDTPHNGDMVYTFLSNGKFALLPGDELILAQWFIEIDQNVDYEASYLIRYDLLTDKGKRKNHTITLEL